MSTPVTLVVAQMGPVLVTRPGSPVFHVASRADVTPSGRWVRRTARAVCSARTGRLSIIPRSGVKVLLGDLRVCARCWARLSATARRAQQPPNNIDQRRAHFAGVTSTDLVVALAIAPTLDELLAVQSVANLLFDQVCTTATARPTQPGKAQGRWDFEDEFLRRRRELVAAERTPEEIEAAAAKREADAAADAQLRASRRRAEQIERASWRRNAGLYLRPHERELLDSAS